MPSSRIAEAYVQIVPRVEGVAAAMRTQLNGQMGDAGTSAGDAMAKGVSTGMGSKIKSYIAPVAASMAGVFAATGIATFFNDAITGASDFAEQGAAVNVVFGDKASVVQEWAANAASAFGLSKVQALDGAKSFGIFANSAGLSGIEAANFSTGLLGLATDLASFNNTSVDDALLALSSGLRGEAEPLRKFGILLDDATLRAQAMKMGLIESTKDALTPQQKVLAANAVIFEQTAKQQGDFARTSDGLANQQRIMAAEFENSKIKLGEGLLPAMTLLATFANDTLIPAFNGLIDFVKEWGLALAAGAGAILIYNAYLGIMKLVTDAAALAQWKLNFAFLANPMTYVVLAIAALVAGIVYLATQTTFFQDAWKVMTDIVSGAWTWLWESVLKPVFDGIAAVFKWIWDYIIHPIVTLILLYIGLWAAIFTWLYEVAIKPALDAIGVAMEWIYDNVIKPVVDRIDLAIRAAGAIFDWLYKNAIKPAMDAIGSAIEWVWINVIKPVADAIGGAFTAIGDAVHDAFDGLGSFIGDVFNGIVGFMRTPINGIIGMINQMIGSLNSIKIDIPDWVPEWGGKSFGLNIPKIPALANGGFVDRPTMALIGEAGPEVVTPLKDFERLTGAGQGGKTVNYYAAPNASLDSEDALFVAIKRAKVVAGW